MPKSRAVSTFQVQLQGEIRYRPALPVVSRIVDKLAVERELGEIEHGRALVGFEYLLGPGIWQLAVADDPASTASGEAELAPVRGPIGRGG